MDDFRKKIQESLVNTPMSDHQPGEKKKRQKSKLVCCALFEYEIGIIEEIKDRGLDFKIVLTPSKIVQIGILLLSHIEVSEIPKYEPPQNQKLNNRFALADAELGTKNKKRYKFFTFTLDLVSFQLLETIIDRGLDIKRVFSVSEILRLSIKQTYALTGAALKDYLAQIKNRTI